MTRLASLCTGYTGLEMGLQLAGLDFELVAVADTGDAAKALLAHRHPGVPNLGDLRTIDWERLEAEVITAGFPCQPVSAAGNGLGTDDERWLFDAIAEGIGRMGARPRLLVFENVLGLLTANGGDAMGRVIRGLARLGYVGRYRVLRASDVGAPHRRARVFIVAWLDGTDPAEALTGGDLAAPGHPVLTDLLPTPRVSDTNGPGVRGEGGLDLRTMVTLLPTPQASIAAYAGDGYGPTLAEVATALLPPPAASRSGRQQSLSPGAAIRPSLDMITALLPTPRASDGEKGGPRQRGSSGDLMLPSAVLSAQWGRFAPAIRRWESVTGMPAPEPTVVDRYGRRLAAEFVEWMMGLPGGWVTQVLTGPTERQLKVLRRQRHEDPERAKFMITRRAALGLLGNGVVPLQSAVAIRELVTRR